MQFLQTIPLYDIKAGVERPYQMPLSRRSFYRLAFLAVCFFICLVSALTAESCSDLDTASTEKSKGLFRTGSRSLCHDFCLSSYAFAVAPRPQAATVMNKCPGYPQDLCGSDGLYGYISLSKLPSGTAGGSAAVSMSAAPTSITPSTTSAVTFGTPATMSKSSSSLSTMRMPTPVTFLETVTGQVRTVTTTPTVLPSAQSLTGVQRKSGGGLSLGGAVGLTIGLVASIAIIFWVVYSCIRKRRQEEEYNNVDRRGSVTTLGGPVSSRSISENSRYGLGTDGRQVVEIWGPEMRGIVGLRRSLLMPVDPRLDPFAPVYQRGENESRESVNTIRDDHDYSRRLYQQAPILRATNHDR
ncbi:hypothetical protein BGZ57DRAFT_1020140 [Hyaloscypha finlandica]|nr:hypothetical protein BGZ57DRAFT_1020140 [Hyaloscypha finlandica]